MPGEKRGARQQTIPAFDGAWICRTLPSGLGRGERGFMGDRDRSAGELIEAQMGRAGGLGGCHSPVLAYTTIKKMLAAEME